MGTLSVLRWPRPRRSGRAVLGPDVLRSERILGDPADPVDACRRARALVQQGALTPARALLAPHARGAGASVIAVELLAAVAVATGASDAAAHLGRARADHERRGDALGLARVGLLEAERHTSAGALGHALRLVEQAAAVFSAAADSVDLAAAEHARAEAHLLVGDLHDALAACNAALAVVAGLSRVRLEARVRLTRARVLATLGRAALATRELVAAAEVLGASASRADRVRLRLTRGEALLLVGAPKRSADGLRRVLAEALALDEVPVLARVHATLGAALLEREPGAARHQLMRARHLYAGCGFAHGVAQCDVGLARAERRLGLNARGRLAALPATLLADSPRLAALARIARAELLVATRPELACAELCAARDHARSKDDAALAVEATRLLVASGLAGAHEAGLTWLNVEPVAGASRHRIAPFARTPSAGPGED